MVERKRDETIFCVKCKTYFQRQKDVLDPDYVEYIPKASNVASGSKPPQPEKKSDIEKKTHQEPVVESANSKQGGLSLSQPIGPSHLPEEKSSHKRKLEDEEEEHNSEVDLEEEEEEESENILYNKRKRDEWSKAVGQHLLQGWAL